MRQPRVIVYVKADHSVSLEPQRLVEGLKPVHEDKISANPFKGEQRITDRKHASRSSETSSASQETPAGKGPDSHDLADEEYEETMATLVFKNIAKNMRWKRLTRQVKTYQVYEEPPL